MTERQSPELFSNPKRIAASAATASFTSTMVLRTGYAGAG